MRALRSKGIELHGYVAKDGGASELARLEALQNGLDANTIRYLSRLGLGSGDACLEVGAGGGSIARWMSRTVGSTGSVVATDLDIEPLAELAKSCENVLLRAEDVAQGVAARPDGRLFDVAHARLVIGHVRDHDRAIANIVASVRPGGWVLIEEADFLWLGLNEQPLYPERSMPAFFRVWKEVAKFLQARGFDVNWGRKLAHAMADAGLRDVEGEAVAMIGNPELTAAMRQTIERFGPDIVRLQHVSAEELDACVKALQQPGAIFTASPLFSVWGRRGA